MVDSNSTVTRDDLPLYHVTEYIQHDGTSLDTRWFATMRLTGNAKEIRDAGILRLGNTAQGPWIKQWLCWGGCGGTDALCHHKDMASVSVRCVEEVGYDRHLSDILCHVQATPFIEWPYYIAELIGSARPYNLIYLARNWRYLVCDVDLEWLMRTKDRAASADGKTFTCL